jgi:predicted NAD-dependent protein-ADP-ribosyltransferase YbiA (DUF1768 family)
LTPTDVIEKKVQFYSKSKDLKVRHLSNFTLFQDKKTGKPTSIEALFQREKYKYACDLRTGELLPKERRDALVVEFMEEAESLQPSQIKRLGGRKAMKVKGVMLDLEGWDKRRVPAMREMIRKRARSDAKYSEMLIKYRDNKTQLFHFERSSKSFWGGHIEKATGVWRGKNTLGMLLQEPLIQ